MFKEAYCKEMERIQPSSSFLKDLAGRMEQETQQTQAKRAGKNHGKVYVFGSVAAAALICIGIFVFINPFRKTADSDVSQMKQNAGLAGSQQEGETGIFDGSVWYGEETEPQKIYDILLNRMRQENFSLSVLENSEADTGVNEPLEDINQMKTLLETGSYVGSKAECGDLLQKMPVRYLLEFEDGVTIGYSIFDGRYFYCAEFDSVFELQDEPELTGEKTK